MLRPRLSYANVTSTLALALVLGGGGAAMAAEIGHNTVGSPQIKPKSVHNSDLANNSVGPAKVKPNSLTGNDIKDGSVQGRDVAGESLTGANVQDGSLTGDDVKLGSLTGDDVKLGSLTGDAVQDGSVTGTDVKDNSLTGADIDESTLNLKGPGVIATGDDKFGTLSATATQVASAELDAPVDGVAYVSVEGEFNAAQAGGYIATSVTEDGDTLKSGDWDAGDVDGLYDQHQNTFVVVPVTAGKHTFGLTLQEWEVTTFSKYFRAQVAVQFVPNSDSSTPQMKRSKVTASPNRLK